MSWFMKCLQDKITVVGAREHNLKDITVAIPRDKLVVISGISGSGKSSLAFDTIFAEGQRRYVELLSAYARQFLGQLDKPDVDYIDGLSPAVSIDQKGVSHNPRSTVGTVTEAYDYLRLLFARIGIPHCPLCGRPVVQQSAQEIVDSLENMPEGSRLLILAPLVRGRKGTHQSIFEEARHSGFVRLRVDGEVRSVEDEIKLDRYKNHTLEAVVDRLVLPPRNTEEAEGFRTRLTDSIETALRVGRGTLIVAHINARPAVDIPFSSNSPARNTEPRWPRSSRAPSPSTHLTGRAPNARAWAARLEIDPWRLSPIDRSPLRRAPWWRWNGRTRAGNDRVTTGR